MNEKKPAAGRMLALEARVSAGLGRRPTETFVECARRVLAAPKLGRAVRMAAHMMLAPGPQWQAMLRADWWLARSWSAKTRPHARIGERARG